MVDHRAWGEMRRGLKRPLSHVTLISGVRLRPELRGLVISRLLRLLIHHLLLSRTLNLLTGRSLHGIHLVPLGVGVYHATAEG